MLELSATPNLMISTLAAMTPDLMVSELRRADEFVADSAIEAIDTAVQGVAQDYFLPGGLAARINRYVVFPERHDDESREFAISDIAKHRHIVHGALRLFWENEVKSDPAAALAHGAALMRDVGFPVDGDADDAIGLVDLTDRDFEPIPLLSETPARLSRSSPYDYLVGVASGLPEPEVEVGGDVRPFSVGNLRDDPCPAGCLHPCQ